MEKQKRSKEKFNVKCDYCGKDLIITPCELQYEKHFCNTKCHHLYISQEAKNKEIKTKCAYCGKDIIKKITNKTPKNYFCSLECNNKYQKEQSEKNFIEVKCSNCGKIFKKRKSNILKEQNLFFCSRKCNFEYKKTKNIYVIDNQNNLAKIIIKYRTNKEHEVLIDINDIEKCKKYLWGVHTLNYVRSKEIGLLHRYIMNCPDNKVIDHINHNPLDNRKCNLRICDILQNNHNKITSNDESGIYKTKSGKYIVRLFYKGKTINLGTYKDKNIAIKVRKDYKKGLKIYG